MLSPFIQKCAAAVAVVMIVGAAWADSVQLVNGDVLNGRVLGLDEQHLRIESDVHGKLNIPRAKVAAITFGDRKPAPIAAPAAPKAAAASTLDDVLKQLKGVGPSEVGDIQKMIPLLTNPEAFGFFQDKLRGLQDGSLSVQDIRKEAMKAVDQVKALKLGPDADQALAPYLGILDRFIRDADPARSQPPPAKTEKK